MSRWFVGSASVLLAALGQPANAADLAARPAAPPWSWAGAYVGGHFGYGLGSLGGAANPEMASAWPFPPTVTGYIAGLQAGYNRELGNRLVLGAEADVSVTSPQHRPVIGVLPYSTSLNEFGTVQARVGYDLGRVMPFVGGGFAWGSSNAEAYNTTGDIGVSATATHLGWAAGAGLDYALGGPWSARLSYTYIDLNGATVFLGSPYQPELTVTPRLHLVSLGLNYRLGEPAPASGLPTKTTAGASAPGSDDWAIHAQTTFLPQGYLPFHAPYTGPNSLPPGGEVRETWTGTAFIGWRVWQGGEIYFNPEIAQGFGIGGTLGLGGFANGEAQKAGADIPKIRAQRYFLRQTFGLGGEQEEIEDGPNQLAGKQDIDRLTLTIGRFAVGDIFDANSYAHDPRADFMNWALWSSAAYDFPADLPGYTRGAVADFNRKTWALRAGLFQVPETPNADTLTWRQGGAVVEFEERHTLMERQGKVRVGAFANRGNTANYSDVLALTAAMPLAGIGDITDATRRVRTKSGFYVNVEQAVTDDVGVFGRYSWNDGRTEILSFTDIDRSLSGGVSVAGRSWGRPDDRIGLGGAINGLSGPHRDFVAAGGLGLLIGDGTLNYSDEKLIEGYYALRLAKWATLSFDYQFITNPAYNADRGPVSVFSSRLHMEF